MLSKFLIFIKKAFFPFVLFLVVVFISLQNFTPGTFLSGWDTLHPEFDFNAYLKRIFFGVWQEHQGVGALASQSHASEVSRMPIFYFLHLLLPDNLVRYAFFDLTLLLGVWGVYFAFLSFVKKDNLYSRLAAFIGSLFYLLNLYTVGQYYVPLEMFGVYFASVPWIFYGLVRFFDSGKIKDLLIFAIISFFSSSMAHTPTLFYTFSLCFLGFFIFLFVFNFSKNSFTRLFLAGLVYLLVNSYWILPNLYFIGSGGAEVVEKSRIHLNFTPEAFLQSKAYGDLKSVVLGKSFLFNWREFSFKENTFVDLLDEWEMNLSSPYIEKVGFLLFSLCILGLVFSLLKKNKILVSLLLPFLISFFFLVNENPPFETIFSYLRENYSILREALRFPFTKFSFTYTFPLSIYLSFFFFFAFDIFLEIRKRIIRWSLVILTLFFFVFVLICIIFYSLPTFRGFLISPSMRVSIPQDYFQVFDWFRKNANFNERIAKLPLQTHWGWGFYSWGYQGAGFTWFGIKQPTLDREFDRWSPYNETFYNEASNILYHYYVFDKDKVEPCLNKKTCQDKEDGIKKIEEWNKRVVSEFENVLEKYRVSYLLLDESIINPQGDSKILYIPEIKDLISKSSRIKEVARFGFLTIYHFEGSGSDPVQAPPNYSLINADLKYSKYDPLYQKYGNYVSFEGKEDLGSKSLKAVNFPFVNFDPRGPVKIQILGSNIEFVNKGTGAKVILPIKEKVEEKFNDDQGFKEGYNCDLKKKGQAVKERFEKGNFYGAYDGGVSCDWFYYPNLDRSKAYVFRISGQNLKGRSLKIYLQNLRTGRMDLEELLQVNKEGKFDSYFLILPSEPSFQDRINGYQLFSDAPHGYTLNVETRSFGRIASENTIENISFVPIDINWLYQITGLESGELVNLQNRLIILSFKKYGTWGYKIDTLGSGLLQLNQGYDNGWVGVEIPNFNLQIKNFKLLQHVKVNGWANGWIVGQSKQQLSPLDSELDEVVVNSKVIQLQSTSNVYLFFWPQILEWGGMIVVIATLTTLVLKRYK